MNLKKSKLPVKAAVFSGVIIFVTGIINLLFQQWKNSVLSLLALLCLTIPFIITRIAGIKKLVLPPSFQLAAVIFIFSAQYLGEIAGFYKQFLWWDLFLHAVFGIYGVIVGLHLTEGIIAKGQYASDKRFTAFTAIFAFSFAITLGTLWEMFEFTGDYLLKTRMITGGINDTAGDLLIKIASASITSIVCFFHKRRQ